MKMFVFTIFLSLGLNSFAFADSDVCKFQLSEQFCTSTPASCRWIVEPGRCKPSEGSNQGMCDYESTEQFCVNTMGCYWTSGRSYCSGN
jgi:hypothetical protein